MPPSPRRRTSSGRHRSEKSSREVEAKFGRPTNIEKLKDTGGARYSYRAPGQPHYVFEFSPGVK